MSHNEIKMESRQGYYERHACCPNCHTMDFESTTMAYFHGSNDTIYDPNRVYCICGWKGRVYELIPKEERR